MIKLCYITGEMSDDFDKALELGANAGIDTVQLRMGLFGKNIENSTMMTSHAQKTHWQNTT